MLEDSFPPFSPPSQIIESSVYDVIYGHIFSSTFSMSFPCLDSVMITPQYGQEGARKQNGIRKCKNKMKV